MRIWKKKYYKEIKCMACDGTGKIIQVTRDEWTAKELYSHLAACPCCKGRGTQTVLEREE